MSYYTPFEVDELVVIEVPEMDDGLPESYALHMQPGLQKTHGPLKFIHCLIGCDPYPVAPGDDRKCVAVFMKA